MRKVKRRHKRYNNHLWFYSVLACICLLTMGVGYAILSAENNIQIDVTKTIQSGAGDTIKDLLGSNSSVDSGEGILEKIEQPATVQTLAQIEYRYRGKDPNNYITFNNETWRIIGIVDGKVKLIRNESIGEYAWNNKGVNEWSISSLKIYLNGTYYNGLTRNAQLMIEESTWYLGGAKTTGGIYSSEMYEKERGTTVYNCYNDNGGCPRNIKLLDKIAIMYPSDYGYGALSSCKKDLYSYDTDVNCQTSNWLFKNIFEWTLTPGSSYFSNAFFLSSNGKVADGGDSSVLIAANIRPTLYLKSNVLISGGDGSSSNPYQLTLG